MTSPASVVFDDENHVLCLAGRWSVGDLSHVEQHIHDLSFTRPLQYIDATQITAMDTAGAFLLYTLQQKLSVENNVIKINALKDNFKSLLELVGDQYTLIRSKRVSRTYHNFFYHIGKKSVAIYQHFIAFLAFLGEVIADLLFVATRPVKLQWRSIVHEIDTGGYRGMPIVAVMMFLIGVVVAYQLGVQLRIYAANVYVVDLSGVAILREFSPLIVSVIIAGRTSTAFAALLGTMKVNEELDALRTMGLSPVERLVLPKIIGLLIALPLLVVWGDVFGMLGSMIMAKNMMGIGFYAFLERFKQEVAIKHLYLGLIKTPVFALIVAGIGCYQGFQAEGSAQSVGERTTKAAVQAIFLIILSDGLFSILFNWMDI